MAPPDTLFPITEAQRTAHARQLRAGFATLRFEPTLEAAFMADFDRSLNDRLAWLATLVLVIWLGFAAADHFRVQPERLTEGQHHLWLELRVLRGAVGGFLAVATWRAWRQRLGPYRRAWLTAGALLVTLGGAWGATVYLRLGYFQPMEVLLLLMAGLFLPIGLTLRQTLPLAAVCLVGMTLVGVLHLEGAAQVRFWYFAGLMLVTALLAAFGAYHREYAQRQQFLLRAELGYQAGHDSLTGLCNRRLFDERLGLLLRQAQRDNQPLALLLVDVDWFKRYNDLYGHPAGDAALHTVADLLQGLAARPLDMAARLGGEEMAVLLYGAGRADAQRLAQQAVEQLRQRAVPHLDSPSGCLSISVGGAMAEPGDTPLSLYQRADRLLYEAKHSGRDRALFAS